MHVLFILQTAFSIWMLVHCIRTGREYYWWVIVMIPFGELASAYLKRSDRRWAREARSMLRSL